MSGQADLPSVEELHHEPEMRRGDVLDDEDRLLAALAAGVRGRVVDQQLAEEGGVGGQDGAVGSHALSAGHQGDVGELHPLADGLHHVLDMEENGGTRLKVLQEL